MNCITKDILYIGVNDHDLDLFEGQYIVPLGMAYNSYVILDEKIAVMDSVEKHFGEEWLGNLEEALDAFDGIQEDVKELAAYYDDDAWREDFEADEAGRLPRDLKRGVLSEDGLYDILSAHYALTVRLLDTVSTILKNR